MALEFAFKTAPLGSVRRLIVEPDQARLTDEAGAVLEQMTFAAVDSARFVETHARRMAVRRIDLHAGEQRLRVPLNTGSGTAGHEEPLATFYRGGSALLAALAAARPDLEIDVGETTAARKVMFGIGIFSALLGAGLPILAIVTGVSGEKLAGAAVPMAILLLFGVLLARSNRPWQPVPRVACGRWAEALAELAAPPDDRSDES